jgi:hypothetical protein
LASTEILNVVGRQFVVELSTPGAATREPDAEALVLVREVTEPLRVYSW